MAVEAYVRINIEPVFEESVRNKLAKLDLVKEVNVVTGREDLVAKLESPRIEDLLRSLQEKLRKVPNVLRTETSIVIPNNGK